MYKAKRTHSRHLMHGNIQSSRESRDVLSSFMLGAVGPKSYDNPLCPAQAIRVQDPAESMARQSTCPWGGQPPKKWSST